MNEIKVARKRIPGIVRAIDEIAFQTSILTLNAAVEAAGDQLSVSPWSAQAAKETLALLEDSITHSSVLVGMKRAGADRERETGEDEIARMAEQLHRIRCAAPAAAMKHPFSDPR